VHTNISNQKRPPMFRIYSTHRWVGEHAERTAAQEFHDPCCGPAQGWEIYVARHRFHSIARCISRPVFSQGVLSVVLAPAWLTTLCKYEWRW